MKLNSKILFNGKATDYNKYRPNYPIDVYNVISKNLPKSAVIADIGAGTGKFTSWFAQQGFKTYAIEPNLDMAKEAEKMMNGENVIIINGSGEKTLLQKSSVDLITIAQAFHWLDEEKCKKEFLRILKKHGKVAIVWNTRDFTSSPFMIDLKLLLLSFSLLYKNMKEKYWENLDHRIESFYFSYEYHYFINYQYLTLHEFIGYLQSLSYTPDINTHEYNNFIHEAEKLFFKHESNNKVKINLITKLYVGDI